MFSFSVATLHGIRFFELYVSLLFMRFCCCGMTVLLILIASEADFLIDLLITTKLNSLLLSLRTSPMLVNSSDIKMKIFTFPSHTSVSLRIIPLLLWKASYVRSEGAISFFFIFLIECSSWERNIFYALFGHVFYDKAASVH